jgi:acetylornithine deacetylase
VDELAPELIAFLQQMVRTPSLPNEEGPVQALVADKLAALGLSVEIVPTRFTELEGHPAFSDDGFSPDSRVNVVARWGPASSGAGDDSGSGSLLLQGHVDVVSPGDERLWERSPWSGDVVDGRLYGRGSCDMKSGVSAGIFALAALKRIGLQPAHEIMFQSVTGEESGGMGALATIVRGYRADAAIILEPTNRQACPLQAGALTFRLTVTGKAAHGAMKSDGVSAIDKFMLINQALNELDARRHAAYHNPLYANPRNVAPISIGTIRGGEWHSTVPEAVVAEGRCGVFPGEQIEDVRALLEKTVADVAAVDPWLQMHPPVVEWFEGQFEAAETDVDHPMIRLLRVNHGAIYGAEPEIRGVPYGADLRLYVNHAHMPAVLYGPGDVALAHTANESVPVDEVIAAAKAVAMTVVDWCGVIS